MVGDRGMISHKAIDELRETDGIGWITALKSASIRALVEQGQLQLGLFDERNLLELSSPDYPGERLVACRNPELAKLRAHKREAAAGGYREEPAEDQGPRRRGQARRRRRDRPARGQGGQPVQGRQALRSSPSATTASPSRASARHRRRGGARRHLHHPHLGRCDAHGGGRLRAQLQGAGPRRARVSLAQDGRPEGAPDPPPHRRSGARAHLPVHARLLRRVAHARGLARADVRRHRPGGQGDARSGGAGQALASGAGQGAPATRWTTARPRTASRPCWPNWPPSCATPATRPAPGPMRRPSTSSPRPTPSSGTPSN